MPTDEGAQPELALREILKHKPHQKVPIGLATHLQVWVGALMLSHNQRRKACGGSAVHLFVHPSSIDEADPQSSIPRP
jgi:hypothetical protein